jgi:UDP:flavonoid glycosyltransferase YjiC (YdhE family)
MGLTVDKHDDGFPIGVQDLLDAIASLDVELVATISDVQRDKLERVPDNARLVPYVPLQALLPTCAALIHHGGVGTMITAAQHAVPQLVLPFDADQPELAARLAARGAGLALHASAATGARVRENLERLLSDPDLRRGADDLRAEVLAQPTPHDLVPRLEEEAKR